MSLSQNKCSKIHVGKESDLCPKLKVHNNDMKESKQEKYLGDQISCSGKIKATIEDRAAKGYRLDMGLKLRQAKLINGILFSSEGWQGLGKDDLKVLEKVDESLLRALLQSHPKTPLEFLHLETGAVKISHIVSCRRLIYLQTLLLLEKMKNLPNEYYVSKKKTPAQGTIHY